MKRKHDKLIIFIFISFIFVMMIGNFVNADRSFSDNENRKLAQKPAFTINKLFSGKYMVEYEKYVNDQFIFRDNWINLKAYSEIMFGKIENNNVYLGSSLVDKFTNYDQTVINNNISAINKFMKKNDDINVSALIVPTSGQFYQNQISQFAYNLDQEKLLQEIKSKIKGSFVDVYSDFANSEEDLYFKYDHHYNIEGAYLTYQAYLNHVGLKAVDKKDLIREVVSDNFRGTLYSKSGLFNIKGEEIVNYYHPNLLVDVLYDQDSKATMFLKDNLKKKDQYTYFLDGNHALTQIDTHQEGKKLLLVKDSYAHILTPLLAKHYSQIILVDPRYYKESISDLVLEKGIDEVLIIYNLDNFTKDLSLGAIK
ncbi:MAG: DHHW family protein [Erysipelotrichaceae bacterium]